MKGRELQYRYLKSHAGGYAAAILMIIISNGFQAYFPKILGEFIDELSKGIPSVDVIYHYSLLLSAVGLFYAALFGLGQYTVMRLGRMFEYQTRQQLFLQFAKLSERYFSKRGIGALLSHVMNDVTSVREAISFGVTQTINAIFLITSTFVMMIISRIPLQLIFVCILPLVVIPFLVVTFGPRIRSRSMSVQESLANMTEAAEEQLGGIRVTKTFAAEKRQRERFGQTVDQIVKMQLRLVRLSSLFQALLPFMGSLSITIALIYGGYLTIEHRLTLGLFVALTLYLRMIVNPLQAIGGVINAMQRSRASLDRLNLLLAEVPDIRDDEHAADLPCDSLEIKIHNLTFQYPDTEINALEGVDITIEPGKTIGIVGKTGSGKTTLLKLLLRIYDPPVHSISIGGIEIHKIKLESLRTKIAYVPQDGFLFSTTIRDNIAFSNREAPIEAIESASKEAHLYETIQEFPESFETILGERGVTLSGGQRQRTSLSRGFLKNAPILLLDDSVSAVDSVTESRILDSIRKSRKGKTTFIVAHRISAVQHADEIIVLDQGRIAERGTHNQLIRQNGIYRQFYLIQGEGNAHGDTGSN